MTERLCQARFPCPARPEGGGVAVSAPTHRPRVGLYQRAL